MVISTLTLNATELRRAVLQYPYPEAWLQPCNAAGLGVDPLVEGRVSYGGNGGSPEWGWDPRCCVWAPSSTPQGQTPPGPPGTECSLPDAWDAGEASIFSAGGGVSGGTTSTRGPGITGLKRDTWKLGEILQCLGSWRVTLMGLTFRRTLNGPINCGLSLR